MYKTTKKLTKFFNQRFKIAGINREKVFSKMPAEKG